MYQATYNQPKGLFVWCKTALVFFFLGLLVPDISVAKDNMSSERKLAIVNALQKSIEAHYVETMLIPDIQEALTEFALTQNSSLVQDEAEFLQELRSQLKRFDEHFSVSHVPETLPNSGETLSWFERLAQNDYGFTRVEKLKNNIGLIDFWGFADATEAAKMSVKENLESLLGVDGLIIDLRNNGGGSAQMVQYISSFFLSGKIHLNSFYSRISNQTQDFYTDESIDYPLFNKIPIVILISNKTFSAAEEFAYNFKHLNRAVILGEPSKGGANPWQYFTLTLSQKKFSNNSKPDVRVAIPTAKAINPNTKQNWEGKGVQPHQRIASDDAEALALSMLLRKIR